MHLIRKPHLGRDEKRRPGYHDEQARGQIVDVEILQLVSREHDLNASDAEVAKVAEREDPGGIGDTEK